MPFRHELHVGYDESDPLVLVKGHHLNYVAEASDRWFRETLGEKAAANDEFELALKRTQLMWSWSGATLGDTLAIDVDVRRWDTTSFDVSFRAWVSDKPIFEAISTYVSVAPGTKTRIPVPEQVRAALS